MPRKPFPAVTPLSDATNVVQEQEGQEAWSFLLDAEAYILTLPGPQSRVPLIAIRVPTTKQESYDKLIQVGCLYRDHLLRIFRSNAGRRPTPSQHASRPSFDGLTARILTELDEVSMTKSSARRRALFRDGHKCKISGCYDRQSIKLDKIRERFRASEDRIAVDMEVAHIFSESAQDGSKEYAAIAFAILDMFHLGDRVRQLYGGEVNDLHNVISMSSQLYNAFDLFQFWLEPVPGMPNFYDTCGDDLDIFQDPIPDRIQFSVDPVAAAAALAKGKVLLLPDPTLLALRAACARVANLSGAAEQADSILRDLEETMVLADDGSMADLLSTRLTMLTPTIPVHW